MKWRIKVLRLGIRYERRSYWETLSHRYKGSKNLASSSSRYLQYRFRTPCFNISHMFLGIVESWGSSREDGCRGFDGNDNRTSQWLNSVHRSNLLIDKLIHSPFLQPFWNYYKTHLSSYRYDFGSKQQNYSITSWTNLWQRRARPY